MKRFITDKWHLRFLVLLFAVLIWRLLYLWIAPLDLAPDEAYYWDWSRHLDWCYYSKPPMVAWIIALSTRTLGVFTETVRMPAVFLWGCGTIFLYMLARRLFDSKTAFWAILAGILTPGSCALGFIMTIDAPLVCLWSISMYALWRALEEPAKSLKWWLLMAASSGLGLLSKQIMIAFPLLMLLFMAISPNDRNLLKTWRPYASIGGSLIFLIPVMLWNFEHNWITLHHTGHHFEGHSFSVWSALATFFDFFLSQAGLMSPLTWFLLILAAGGVFINWQHEPRPAPPVSCSSSAQCRSLGFF